MQYLIIRCEELGDQFECDANRIPYCITNDCSKYGRGYEVYEILDNGKFNLIKDYDVALEEGFVILRCDKDNEIILEKYKNMFRHDISMSKVQKWKKKYHLPDTAKDILKDIRCCGDYFNRFKDEGYSIIIKEYFE